MRSGAPWATASPAGRAFVTSLRHSDADARLGAGGASEVRAHPFLAGVDWSAMQAGAVPAPFLPARSTANFELHADDVLNTLDGGLTPGARKCQPPAADDADFAVCAVGKAGVGRVRPCKCCELDERGEFPFVQQCGMCAGPGPPCQGRGLPWPSDFGQKRAKTG